MSLIDTAFILACLYWAGLVICLPFIALCGYFVYNAVKAILKRP